MSRTLVRTGAAILVLSALALPLSAQPEPGRAPSLLAHLWDRINAPVMALFSTSETDVLGVLVPAVSSA